MFLPALVRERLENVRVPSLDICFRQGERGGGLRGQGRRAEGQESFRRAPIAHKITSDLPLPEIESEQRKPPQGTHSLLFPLGQREGKRARDKTGLEKVPIADTNFGLKLTDPVAFHKRQLKPSLTRSLSKPWGDQPQKWGASPTPEASPFPTVKANSGTSPDGPCFPNRRLEDPCSEIRSCLKKKPKILHAPLLGSRRSGQEALGQRDPGGFRLVGKHGGGVVNGGISVMMQSCKPHGTSSRDQDTST